MRQAREKNKCYMIEVYKRREVYKNILKLKMKKFENFEAQPKFNTLLKKRRVH